MTLGDITVLIDVTRMGNILNLNCDCVRNALESRCFRLSRLGGIRGVNFSKTSIVNET